MIMLILYIVTAISFAFWTESVEGGIFVFCLILSCMGLIDRLGEVIRRY